MAPANGVTARIAREMEIHWRLSPLSISDWAGLSEPTTPRLVDTAAPGWLPSSQGGDVTWARIYELQGFRAAVFVQLPPSTIASRSSIQNGAKA